MTFKNELKNFLAEFEPYSQRYFRQKTKSVLKYPKLIKRFYADLEDFMRGGKKLRAFLVYWGFKIAGGSNLKKILPVSFAFEMFHNFLLIHDDIADKSEKRRGEWAIHKLYEMDFGGHYGMSQAIIIGDIACIEAFEIIAKSDFDPKLKELIIQKLSEILLETDYGQALDVEYSFKKPKLSDVWQVADLKSARYSFVGPLTIGAQVARARASQIEALTRFGSDVGIAFQLRDDVLGLFGQENRLGKSTLSDLREGKNTLLVYKARELVSGRNRDQLDQIWGKESANKADLDRVRKIVTNCGALKWCQTESEKLVQGAKLRIKKITSNPQYQQILMDLADFVIMRDH